MDRYLKDEPKPKTFKTEPGELIPWEFTTPGLKGTFIGMKIDPLCFDELLNDRNLDTLSMSSASSTCSGKSWDSPISCSVKKERIDDEYDDSDSNDEKIVNCRKNSNNNNSISKNFNTRNIQIIKSTNHTSSGNKLSNSTIELLIRTPSSNHLSGATLSTMLMPATLHHGHQNQHETLTPPSSPESSSTNKCSKNNLTIRETTEPELAAIIDNQGIFRVSNGTTLTRNTIVRLSNSKNSLGITKILQMSPTQTTNANMQQTTIASTTTTTTAQAVTTKGGNLNQTGEKFCCKISSNIFN